jgi:hypothetical protein
MRYRTSFGNARRAIEAEQGEASQQHNDRPLRRGIGEKPRERLGLGLQEKCVTAAAMGRPRTRITVHGDQPNPCWMEPMSPSRVKVRTGT